MSSAKGCVARVHSCSVYAPIPYTSSPIHLEIEEGDLLVGFILHCLFGLQCSVAAHPVKRAFRKSLSCILWDLLANGVFWGLGNGGKSDYLFPYY